MARLVQRSLAAPTALLLSLLLAGQASAASWGPSVILNSSGHAAAGGMVALRDSVVIATYADEGAVFVRRSNDSGVTWQSPRQLAGSGFSPEIAGRGQTVDVVWSTGNAVRYVRSADSGVSFTSAKTLTSSSAGGLGSAMVARGPDNVVAVAWTRDGIALARVSHDGGQTFGPAATLNDLVEQAVTAIAVGNRVVYVATAGLWVGCDGGCAGTAFGIWRSIDFGATWDESLYKGESSAVTSISAVGHRAFAGAAYSPWCCLEYAAVYFKTTNRGSTWSGPKFIDYQEGRDMEGPVIVSVRDERLRAAWTHTGEFGAGAYELAYRERPLQGPWTPVEILTKVGNPRAASVDFSGRPIVLFWADESDGSGSDCCQVVRAITRSPP